MVRVIGLEGNTPEWHFVELGVFGFNNNGIPRWRVFLRPKPIDSTTDH